MNGACYRIMFIVPLIPNLIPYLQLKVPWSAIHWPFTQPISQNSLGAYRAGSEREAKTVSKFQLKHDLIPCQYLYTLIITIVIKKRAWYLWCDMLCSFCVHKLAYCQKIREQLPNTSRHTGKAKYRSRFKSTQRWKKHGTKSNLWTCPLFLPIKPLSPAA